MKPGDMELANHSAHHRGANSDEDMDREIGSAAETIWKLPPGRSKLLALNLGGGTHWETTCTLRHKLDKYQTERNSAQLTLVKSDATELTFRIDCANAWSNHSKS